MSSRIGAGMLVSFSRPDIIGCSFERFPSGQQAGGATLGRRSTGGRQGWDAVLVVADLADDLAEGIADEDRGALRRHDVDHAYGEQVEVLIEGAEDTRCQVIAAGLADESAGYGVCHREMCSPGPDDAIAGMCAGRAHSRSGTAAGDRRGG